MPAPKRVRRTLEASRQAILETAERHLQADGPEGVKVQRVAHDLGLTDAAVHYHFGNRNGLLEALLRFSGRRFVAEIEAAVAARGPEGFDIPQAAALLTDLYGRRGTARLAMQLMLSGWSPEGEGMLRPLAEWLHAARTRTAAERGCEAPTIEDSQRVIALLSALTFVQALSGDAHFRSADLAHLSAEEFIAWLTDRLD